MLESLRTRAIRITGSLLIAAAIWLPTLHLWFRQSPRAVAAPLAARQAALWRDDDPAEVAALRRTNPEWDLMARTFAVLAFANLALAEPEARAGHLATIDRILERTLREDARSGTHHFLLAYSRDQPFRDPEGRSLFVDGELALMLAARQLVEPASRWQSPLRETITRITGQLERGPVLAGESYPDEGWMFCNVVALAAIRLSDVATGEDHGPLVTRWIASARVRLVDPSTGLLVSSFTWDGRHRDGPEGSTIWLVAHLLQILDEDFARDQYRRARGELSGGALGFAWAREWPAAWPGRDDVDSGPTVPILDANAGSSGLALVAARSFGDAEFADGLIASLGFGGFGIEDATGLRFAAGNVLADAVLLYGLVHGPLWKQVQP